MTVSTSHGVLVAQFDDGAIVFDTVAQVGHRVNALAALVLNSALHAGHPIALEELVEQLVDETGADAVATHNRLQTAVAALTDLGLLGRTTQPELFGPIVPTVSAPKLDWAVGATRPYLDHRLAFCGPDAALISAIDEFLGAPVTDDRPTAWFGVVPTGDGHIDLFDDSQWRFSRPSQLLWQLPNALNVFVSRSDTMVVLHAGAVRTPDGSVVVVTGPINAGKSTLISALVRAGCDYLSDESVGIAPETLHAWGYPKPLTLSVTSQHLIGVDPPGEPHTPAEHLRAEEIRSDVQCLGGEIGPVDLVVHTVYAPAQSAGTTLLGPGDAIKTLLRCESPVVVGRETRGGAGAEPPGRGGAPKRTAFGVRLLV